MTYIMLYVICIGARPIGGMGLVSLTLLVFARFLFVHLALGSTQRKNVGLEGFGWSAQIAIIHWAQGLVSEFMTRKKTEIYNYRGTLTDSLHFTKLSELQKKDLS